MLQTLSEWAVAYFQVGGIIGFGLGALAQCFDEKSKHWTLGTCLTLTIFWPMIFWNSINLR